MKLFFVFLALGLTFLAGAQDTVILKSGEKLECKVNEYESGTIKITDPSGKPSSLDLSTVKQILFDRKGNPAENPEAPKGKPASEKPKRNPNEEAPAGGGFFYKNVRFSSQLGMQQAIGEMTNKSGKNCMIANFIVSLYDIDGNLLQTGYANISNFEDSNTKSFEAIFMGVDLKKIDKFKIQFENAM